MLTLARFFDVGLVALALWAASLAVARRWRPPTRRGRLAWWAMAAMWALAWLAATPAVALALVRSLEPLPASVAAFDVPALRARTAVVVLGSSIAPPVSGATPMERLDSASTARAIGAARVWRVLQAGALIVSGRGSRETPDAAARAMADLAVACGVPRERVVIEPWSLNTRQNAANSVRVGRRTGFDRFVVVTSALHMPRALREFRRAGVEALAAPVNYTGERRGGLVDWVPVAWGWTATEAAMHEYLGMLKP